MDINKLKNIINSVINENLDLIEDYPSSFNMEDFKQLDSFNKRIKYCEQHLKRISSGSARIVYQIDNEKVLKLAKNKKGLAQNEIEIEYSNYADLDDVVTKAFDYHQNDLWVEMELARKVTVSDFKRIVGYSWEEYVSAIQQYGSIANPRKNPKFYKQIDKELYDEMWENEFMYDIFSFIGNYDLPVGDLIRISNYGLVKRSGQDHIVIIDFGLTHDVYDSYYGNK